MKLCNLKTNHLVNPLGFELEYLFFSWEVQDTEAKTDLWTQVRVARDENFQTIVFDSNQMHFYGEPFYQADFKPDAATRYYWQVTIETDRHELACGTAWFETALDAGAWPAEWIGARREEEEMPCFYRDFDVKNRIKTARLYCCGLGLYECYINEEKAGEEFLMPGYHSYDMNIQYQTYDVMPFLRQGENRIAFILGEGWYKGRFVFEGGYENLYGKQKILTAFIRIIYEDGSEQSFITDTGWKAVQTEILENNIYDGERIDRTRRRNMISVETVNMPVRKMTARYNVPLRKVESYKVKEVITTPLGDTVLDFGEAITGWVEVKCSGQMDFCLQYGEVMQKNEFYRDNLRTARAEFHFKGVTHDEWIRPHFTYYGFRYVKVTGIQNLEEDNFAAFRLMSDIERTGRITTGNEKVNKLIGNTFRSQQCNFIDIPLDCPQRDERMGWTGDIGVFARTASFHMYTPAFLHHYMKNLRLEQKALQGAVPFFVPRPKPAAHEGINPFLVTAGACAWSDAAAIIPWEIYLHYRDRKMLEIQYPAMCDWVEYIKERSTHNKIPDLWQNDRQLGDWLALDNGDSSNPIGSTDTGLIASAYFYYSTVLCQRAARVLRHKADETKWEQQAEKIKQAFIKEYLDAGGDILCAKTQTAYALLLYFRLYHQDKKAVLVAGLKKTLKKYKYHLSTGFVGTGILLQALCENGLCREAYTVLLQEDYPSWLREVALGATTVWERWNSVNDDKTLSAYGMNSLNHYSYGCVAGWMYEFMCGFRWDTDGSFYLEPVTDRRIGTAEGEYRTMYGTCRIKWSYETSEKIKLTIRIPFQAKMPIVMPWGEKLILDAGTYTF